MARLAFTKYEGLGNDFIVVDAARDDAVSNFRARALCDRRFGVGGDGVLLVLPPTSPSAAARMKVINADGSVPEMCGNGIRCIALHVALARKQTRAEMGIETDAGLRTCTIDRDGNRAFVRVDMGEVRATGERTLSIDGQSLQLFLADAGNPHAIAFGDFSRADVERLGPRVERHESFPNGTNVGFAKVHGAHIKLVVWERGVGVTLACGTGACATAVVARARKLVVESGEVVVELPGGDLVVEPEPAGRTTMTGPAHRVFSGEV